ncbi:MAG: choice-of-anchor tandem repeat GloVer-containing protein [Bryobacteraceae bacterium]|jgi:uncharacterized repeat protein (TIGR03803 family)
MITHFLRRGLSTALCAMAATMASAAGQASFHPIAYMDRFGQAVGISEGSPGVFYFETGLAAAALSITAQGTKTVLATFAAGTNFSSTLISGDDGRFYSAVEIGVRPASFFSIGPAAGSQQVHSSPDLVPSLRQNLPDGTFLGLALAASGGPWQLAKIDRNGRLTPLYQFPAGERAQNVIYASDGNYYGISENGPGYLFRLTASGALTKPLTFPDRTVAGLNAAPLLQGSDGNLYGATPSGGTNSTGTIYRLTPAGQYTLLYAFPKDQNSWPTTLIEASDGNLYGATLGSIPRGGRSELFRVTRTGGFTVLYVMKNLSADGVCQCSLVQGSDGNIYGTAVSGGPANGGVVFVLNAGLPKPVPVARHFNPQSGLAGTPVRIWGDHLLGATVRFDGLAATESSNSGPNYIWAKVPRGAGTGPITITTPGGTVTTHASFTVE